MGPAGGGPGSCMHWALLPSGPAARASSPRVSLVPVEWSLGSSVLPSLSRLSLVWLVFGFGLVFFSSPLWKKKKDLLNFIVYPGMLDALTINDFIFFKAPGR